MAIEEEEIHNVEPILKPIELKNIGFLQKQPTFINCPACEAEALSVVRLEAVTCLQRLLDMTKWWKTWVGRYDINHYCSKCGCFIGRYVEVRCFERCISERARKQAARDDMSLKVKPRDCAVQVQVVREQYLADRERKKAKKITAGSSNV